MTFLVKSERIRTILNLLSGIITMLVQLIVNFFLSPYIVQTLGEEANGFMQLANNFVQYATLITVAFNSMAGRYISVSYHRGEKDNAKKYFSSTVVCNICICLVLIPISLVIVGNLEKVVVIENAEILDVKTLFLCVFLNFFVNLVLSIYSLSMYVTNTLYLQNVINLFRNILNAIVIFVVFNVLPVKVFYVSLIAFILSVISIPLFKYFQRMLLSELHFKLKDFDISAVVDMFVSGIWNTVNQCGTMLMTGFDLLLANWLLTPSLMGVLSVAKMIPNAIISLASVLNISFAPIVTINWAKGDINNTLKQLRMSMRISSIMISIPIVTFSVFAIPFYSLWIPELDAKLLAILSFLTLLGFVPWSGPQALYNVFTATNHLKVNSISFLVAGIMNIILVYSLVKFTNLGILAIAGVSPLLSILRNIIIVAPYTAKLLRLKWYVFYKDVGISLLCGGINFGVAQIVNRFFEISSWFLLAIAVLFTCMGTLVLDMFFLFNKVEREHIFRKITSRNFNE